MMNILKLQESKDDFIQIIYFRKNQRNYIIV